MKTIILAILGAIISFAVMFTGCDTANGLTTKDNAVCANVTITANGAVVYSGKFCDSISREKIWGFVSGIEADKKHK